MTVLQKLLAMMILKSAPQDLPYSLPFAVKVTVVYLLSGVVVLQTTLGPEDMLAGLLLGLLVQVAFTYLVLRALNRSARFVQTVSAIIAVSLLFNLLSWPVFIVVADSNAAETMKAMMSFMFLLIISWEVLVKAHIFRHALEMKMFGALALSFSLFFISVTLSQLLFPQAAG
jgi:hypothetical protein